MGSIARRNNGAWRARFRDETGHEHARHFRTKAEARRWLEEQSARRITGTFVDPRAGRITFRGYFDDVLERRVYEDTTRRAAILAATSSTFADMPMSKIRRSHVEAWVTAMHKQQGLAAGTIKTRFGYVRSVFRAAVVDRVIAEDPTVGVKLPERPRHAATMRLPTTQEVGRLLQAADADFRTFLAVCAFAGLRLGEAAALRLDDIDFVPRTLHVRRQVQRLVGGQIEVRSPKAQSVRSVALNDHLLAMLGEHAERRGLVAGDDDYLFAGTDGQPPHQNTVGHRWRNTRRAVGLGHLKLHDLRHFYASGLISAGCDVVTVQHALGHAKPTTTLNYYAHLWPTAEDRTRSASAALMRDALSAVEPLLSREVG